MSCKNNRSNNDMLPSSLVPRELGLYIHIPFCVKKCAYCDFCSFPVSNVMERYVEKLCAQLRAAAQVARDCTVVTAYIGGGTPSLLDEDMIRSVMNAVKDNYCVLPDAEITVECNPGTVDRKKLVAMKESGINRLSIGAQSLVNAELKVLGRIHSAEEFLSTVALAKEVGFDNISGDLMYGIPDQTMQSFCTSAEKMCKIGLSHISLYALSIEEGTAFYKNKDQLVLPSEETVADMYEMAENILSKHGYEKYEISNFSLPCRESRHNSGYWTGREYLGFGIAAHSYFEGVRFFSTYSLDKYLSAEIYDVCSLGEFDNDKEGLLSWSIYDDAQKIDDHDKASEYIMLGLRLCKGISLEDFFARFSVDFFDFIDISREQVEEYITHGFMKLVDGRLSFTTKGFYVSSAILSEMIGFDEA